VIRYTLLCEAEHAFEGWFRSSDDFDAQAGRGLVACPQCGSTRVGRALMAPAVATSRAREARAAEAASQAEAHAAARAGTAATAAVSAEAHGAGDGPPPAAATPLPVAMPDPRALVMMEMLRRMRRHVEATAENVGERFPEEARKIHYGESDERGIYGQASRDEVEALLDEGIDIHALPLLPEDRN